MTSFLEFMTSSKRKGGLAEDLCGLFDHAVEISAHIGQPQGTQGTLQHPGAHRRNEMLQTAHIWQTLSTHCAIDPILRNVCQINTHLTLTHIAPMAPGCKGSI